MPRDFYAILDVKRDADEQEIKKGYRRMAVKYHPDKHGSKPEAEKAEMEAKFKDAAEAYDILSNPDKRAAYDRYGEQGLRGSGAASFMRGGRPHAFSRSDSNKVFREFFSHGDPFAGFGFGDDDFISGMGGMHGMQGMNGMRGMHGLPGMRVGSFSSFFGPGLRRNRQAPRESESVEWLPPQTAVQLTGLASDSLNGSAGEVQGFDSDKCRYNVRLPGRGDGRETMVAIRPANVRESISNARVVGTSQDELNGRMATKAVFDTPSARYVMEGLSADGRTVALRPEHVVLPTGTRVNIQNVQSRPLLNSKAAKIVAVDAERYTVQLADGEQMRLRFGSVIALHGYEQRDAEPSRTPHATPDEDYAA